MTSLRKVKTNKTKSAKNKIKFTFTKDEDNDCSHGEIIQRLLNKSNKWVFRKLNYYDIFDWINTGSTKILKNCVLNDYIGDRVCELTNKFDFHKNLQEKEYIPKTHLILNNTNEILNINNLFDDIYLLKEDMVEGSNGIHLIKNKEDFIKKVNPNQKYVLQKVLEPNLIGKRKSDFRFYVVLSYGVNMLNLHLVKHGYRRISKNNYSNNDYHTIVVNSSPDISYSQIHIDSYPEIINILKDSFQNIFNSQDITQRGYHLLGVDFIQDNNEKIWLLEVNHKPKINVKDFLDKYNINRLFKSIVNIMESLLMYQDVEDINLIKII